MTKAPTTMKNLQSELKSTKDSSFNQDGRPEFLPHSVLEKSLKVIILKEGTFGDLYLIELIFKQFGNFQIWLLLWGDFVVFKSLTVPMFSVFTWFAKGA